MNNYIDTQVMAAVELEIIKRQSFQKYEMETQLEILDLINEVVSLYIAGCINKIGDLHGKSKH